MREDQFNNSFRTEIVKKLTRYFAHCPYPVILAYLFGSQAGGKTTPLSDIDVAVLVDEKNSSKRQELYLPLLSALIRLLGSDRVDLCYLNEESNGVSYAAVKDNVLLYSSDEKRRIEVETNVLNQYSDLKDLHKVRQAYLKKRILAGKMGKGEIEMIDRRAVQERLDYIDSMLKLLRKYRGLSLEEFEKDRKTSHAALYELQTCLEAMTDIGNHIIAAMNLKKPEDRVEVFSILSNEHIISHPLAVRIGQAASMRNIIVHGYLRIVIRVVHRTIQKNLGDIEEFSKEVLRYLETHPQ